MKQFRVQARNLCWNTKVEELAFIGWDIFQFALINCINHAQTISESDSLANSISAVNPSCVNQPYIDIMFSNLLEEHLCINCGVKW